jgi:hypothetical protein
MKNLIGFLSVFAFLGVMAWATEPSDGQCIYQVIAAKTGIHTHARAGDIFYTVHNHFIFKTIENRWTGETVAYGVFTTVILK